MSMCVVPIIPRPRPALSASLLATIEACGDVTPTRSSRRHGAPRNGHVQEFSQAEARVGATEAKTAAAMAALHQSTAAAPDGRRGAAGERLQRSVPQQTLL